MKFRACGPSPAHALKFHAVPSETAHGTFAMLLHSKICLSSAKGRESVRSPAPQCVKKASKSPDMCKGRVGFYLNGGEGTVRGGKVWYNENGGLTPVPDDARPMNQRQEDEGEKAWKQKT